MTLTSVLMQLCCGFCLVSPQHESFHYFEPYPATMCPVMSISWSALRVDHP
jgi:hypothetical protein